MDRVSLGFAAFVAQLSMPMWRATSSGVGVMASKRPGHLTLGLAAIVWVNPIVRVARDWLAPGASP